MTVTKSTRTVTITEREGGWNYGDTLFASAAEALRAVKDGSRQIAALSGGMDICVIHWWPTTRVGRWVVECLTANKPTRIRSRARGLEVRGAADEATCRECGEPIGPPNDGHGTESGLCKRHGSLTGI